MHNKIQSLLQKLPATDALLWEDKQKFETPYTLDECLYQLENAYFDIRNSLKWNWIEDAQGVRTELSFTCRATRSRVSLGLVGQVTVQPNASNQVQAKVGMLYSNIYFFLLVILIAPIFLASGTQPNLLGSYLLSLAGTYVIMLIVGFILALVFIAVSDIASQQLFDDLKLLLKGVS